MHNFLKTNFKKGFIGVIAALAATTSITAKSPFSSQEDKCHYPSPGPFAFNYPKDIGLDCPRDFFFYADFLALQAKEDGLEFAISNTDSNVGDYPITGKVQGFSGGHHDWDFGFGFRLGIGFYLNHDMWTLAAEWTHLLIQESESSATSSSAFFVPLWLSPTNYSSPNLNRNRVTARWKSYYNTFDINLSKPHHISRYFIVLPYIGLRGAWIDQNYDVNYDGTFSSGHNVRYEASNDWWGVGLRAGFNSEYLLGGGWALFGRTAGSILYGKFDIDQFTPLTISSGFALNEEFYDNTTNLELALGISWGIFFGKNRYHFNLALGYEFHEWFSMNRMRKFFGTSAPSNDTISRGDFSLNGISLRAVFDF